LDHPFADAPNHLRSLNVARVAALPESPQLVRDFADRLAICGTAAVLAEDPDEASVVVTVGTAMEVGFPLERHPRARLDDGFRLD
jgi:hypothetical protein